MNVYIPYTSYDYTQMQGPAPSGFHVPLSTEWQGVKTIMDGLGLTIGDNWRINLHMPFAGYRNYTSTSASPSFQGSYGYYCSSSPYSAGSIYISHLGLGSSYVNADANDNRAEGLSVRCFKNSFELPTSSWTVINGTLGSAGIFWDTVNGLISITGDGTTGYTIQDKNLGATTVYSDGATLSQANCGKYYQWGNNYGFAWTGSVTTSGTRVNAQNYGPGNYYSSSTFITGSKDWSSVINDNLWGATTGVKPMSVLKNIYIGEYGWKPGANTLLYCPLKEDYADHSPNPKTITLNGTVTQDTIGYNFNGGYLVSSAFTGPTTHTTMSIWAKPNGIRSNYQALFSKYYGSFTYPYATTSIGIADKTSNADFSIANSSATLRNTLASLTMGSWQLITGTYDGSNVKIYINGQLISSTSESSSILSNNTQLSIGNYLGVTQLFYGNLSEAIFENKARTAEEVAKYYNQTKSNYGL